MIILIERSEFCQKLVVGQSEEKATGIIQATPYTSQSVIPVAISSLPQTTNYSLLGLGKTMRVKKLMNPEKVSN